jgi:molybdopterin-containing oxidoreductase family iron-sulfur binding subunit
MSEGRMGERQWRSLDELAETPAFREMVEREFPDAASEWADPISRRRFLQLMGASLALAGLGGLAGCTRQPDEPIVPYVRQPEGLVPGKPLFFATAVTLGGFALGVLVESHMGRPTKVEGNPDHPASRGATDAIAQAAVLGLYDPDRSQTTLCRGEIRSWGAFVSAMRVHRDVLKAQKGAGLRILTETITSPALAAEIGRVLAELPEARWHQWEPVNRDMAIAGAKLAFGEPVAVRHDLGKADVVLALDADFLASGPARVRYARDFAARRRVRAGEAPALARLYAVEATPTLTGSKADHRLAVRPSRVAAVARAIERRLAGEAVESEHAKFVDAVAADLAAAKGRSVVIAGDFQPPHVHALAHALNSRLGNVGKTVFYTDPVEAAPVDETDSLRGLCRDMADGKVELLLVLGANPAYAAPPELGFADALGKVATRVHCGLYQDETAALCHWHVPAAHELECWGDARAFDGTATIQQPLIAPLYGGKSALEMLSVFTEAGESPGLDLLRHHWKREHENAGGAEDYRSRWADDFEVFWRQTLHDGVVAGTALPARDRALRPFEWPKEEPAARAVEVAFRPDAWLHDGRFANLGWLQELPRPLTSLVWENAALVSKALADRLRVKDGDFVDVACEGRSVHAPAVILPGQPDDTVTLHLGYGRTRAGRVGNGAGFDVGPLRSAKDPWQAGALIVAAGGATPVVRTHGHHGMEGRNLARSATLAEWRADPRAAHHGEEPPPRSLTLYPDHKYEGHAWGMAIDLGTCIGCNACAIACQAENNIPVVGKSEVLRQREMHWIRVDTYFEGPVEDPRTIHQPVPCMQCENAPCEVVCPVAATSHSAEGLNDMVYNRCVGTRYCANNCPYKVRRFNFFLYTDPVWKTPSLQLLQNPDVTVRSRGVMEKCTYCVQRINAARIEAKKADRPIADGEIVTACQQVCPAEAIVFGDLNDPESKVSRVKADPLNYGLLAELNTRPRTTYLAKVRNPSPALEAAAPGEGGGHG